MRGSGGSDMTLLAAAAAAMLLAFSGAAEAKRARCFSTDDGYYPCNFVATDGLGSFEISARAVSYTHLDVYKRQNDVQYNKLLLV